MKIISLCIHSTALYRIHRIHALAIFIFAQCFQLKLIKFGNVINSALLRFFLRQYSLFVHMYACIKSSCVCVCVLVCTICCVANLQIFYCFNMATNETQFIQFKMMCVFVTLAYISVSNDKSVHLKRTNCKYENSKLKTQAHTHTQRERYSHKKSANICWVPEFIRAEIIQCANLRFAESAELLKCRIFWEKESVRKIVRCCSVCVCIHLTDCVCACVFVLQSAKVIHEDKIYKRRQACVCVYIVI